MTQVSRWRPSPATAISCLALFVALSGSAVALQGRNTVASNDIKPGAVKRSDIALNALNSPRVANGTLRQIDFAPGTLLQGPQGPQGPPGPEGPPGPGGGGGGAPSGPAGGGLAGNYPNPTIAANAVGGAQIVDNSVDASELGTITLRQSAANNVAGGGFASATANCLAGEQVISGGADVSSTNLNLAEFRLSGNGWFITAKNNTGVNQTLQAEVLCLAP